MKISFSIDKYGKTINIGDWSSEVYHHDIQKKGVTRISIGLWYMSPNNIHNESYNIHYWIDTDLYQFENTSFNERLEEIIRIRRNKYIDDII
jgi:hypothetical protein